MLSVVSLGRVVCKGGFYASNLGRPIVFPVGFEVHRPVFGSFRRGDEPVRLPGEDSGVSSPRGKSAGSRSRSSSQTSPPPTDSELHFIISITEDPSGEFPVFTIRRSDQISTKVYSCDRRPTKAIRDALDDAARDFADKKDSIYCSKDLTGSFTISGPRFLGLSLVKVINGIKGLPEGEKAFKESAASIGKTKEKESDGMADEVEEKGSGTVKTTRGKAVKAPKASPKTATAAAKDEVCPQCGLAGTPFCAKTGMAHALPVCALCGLNSEFCPISGERHQSSRANRKKGDVKLPGTKRGGGGKAASKASSPASPAGGTEEEVKEVVVVNSQSPSKEKRKRSRPAAAEETAKKKGKVEAGKTAKSGPLDVVLETERNRDQIFLADLFGTPAARTLRPCLTTAEQSKAATLLHSRIKATAGTSNFIAAPFEGEFRLSFAPRRPTQKSRRGRGKKEEGEATGSPTSPGEVETPGVEERAGTSPLDVALSDAASERRFLKFMLQYASERTKLQALRDGPEKPKGEEGGVDKKAAEETASSKNEEETVSAIAEQGSVTL